MQEGMKYYLYQHIGRLGSEARCQVDWFISEIGLPDTIIWSGGESLQWEIVRGTRARQVKVSYNMCKMCYFLPDSTKRYQMQYQVEGAHANDAIPTRGHNLKHCLGMLPSIYFLVLPLPLEGPRAASLLFASRASISAFFAFSIASRSSFSACMRILARDQTN